MDTIDLMLEIAETAGIFEVSEFKTGMLAKKLYVSQQTISNELRRLEKEGLLERRPFYLGVNVKITEKGRETLKKYKKRLDTAFTSLNKITGKLFSGIGEGKFYVMQKGYLKQFKEKLGINPYHGTLNMKVLPSDYKKFLEGKKYTTIEGFNAKQRTFGSLNCYEIKINGIKGYIIVPARTHYKEDTVEVISDIYLRERLRLKDNDKLTISEA